MRQIEVEAKIKVRDVSAVRERIKKIAKFAGVENKLDEYYALDVKKYPAKSLRIRRMGKDAIINFKESVNYADGVHAKKEVEFKISDLPGALDLLEDFGFKKWIKKEKRTELYKTKNASIELNKVKGLGWFVEIEILCTKNRIDWARKEVLRIIDELDFDEKDIEKSGYTKALWDKKK